MLHAVVVEFQQTRAFASWLCGVRVCGQQNRWTFNDFITLDVIANRQTPKSVIVTEIVWIDSAGGSRNYMNDVYSQASLNMNSMHESCSLHVQNKTEAKKKIEFISGNWFGWIPTMYMQTDRWQPVTEWFCVWLTFACGKMLIAWAAASKLNEKPKEKQECLSTFDDLTNTHHQPLICTQLLYGGHFHTDQLFSFPFASDFNLTGWS